MTIFINLPTEIITYVIQLTKADNDRDNRQVERAFRTLCSLRYVCKRISNITTPILFRRVHLVSHRAIINLTHLLIVKPSMKEHIRGVVIGNERGNWRCLVDGTVTGPGDTILESMQGKLFTIVNEAKRLRFDESFRSILGRGIWLGAVIMLFHVHLELKELVIVNDFIKAFQTQDDNLYEWWAKLGHDLRNNHSEVLKDTRLYFTSSPIKILSNLEVLDIRGSYSGIDLAASLIHPFFILPCIKTIRAENVGIALHGAPISYPHEVPDWDISSYMGSSSVTNLELTHASLDSREAEILLQLPKTLRSLKVTSLVGSSNIPSTLHDLAFNGKMKLESLFIDSSGRHQPLYPTISLSICLRFLTIDIYNFLGVRDDSRCSDRLLHSLPQSIETIEFTNLNHSPGRYPEKPKPKYCWCLAEGLSGLINAIDHQTLPNLRRLKVPKQLLELSENISNASTQDLQTLAEKKGIDLVWSNERISYRVQVRQNNGILFHCDVLD